MPTSIRFSKLQGAGNDFVFIQDFNDELDITPSEVISICDRHFGVGADGVIVVKPPENPDNAGFMHYINSDGTIAQMCGNGVRCFAKFVVDNKLAIPDENGCVVVETRAGDKPVRVLFGEEGFVEKAVVDMGKPILEPDLIPALLQEDSETQDGARFIGHASIDSPFGSFDFACVSMGNPHAICFVDDWDALDDSLFKSDEKSLDTFDLDKVGAYFESCDSFPEKANIEFAELGDNGISMRVFERGCGETLACGTGACATAVAAFLTGRASNSSDLVLKGGVLHIDFDELTNTVFMTGPAEFVFRGKLSLS